MLIETLNKVDGGLEARLKDLLEGYRYHGGDKKRIETEAKQVMKRLEGNRKGRLVDDRILRTFSVFLMGPEALSLRKEELIRRVIEEGIIS